VVPEGADVHQGCRPHSAAQAARNCHPRRGALAPMSLSTYEDARSLGRAPSSSGPVSAPRAGVMPPWYVEKNIGIQQFPQRPVAERRREIATLAKWADSGAPRGNPADMPPRQGLRRPPVVGDRYGPDLVIKTKELTVQKRRAPTGGARSRASRTGLTEDRYVAALENQGSQRRSSRRRGPTALPSAARLRVSTT